jgi:hypothetical protein
MRRLRSAVLIIGNLALFQAYLHEQVADLTYKTFSGKFVIVDAD